MEKKKEEKVLIPATKDTLMSWFQLPIDVDPTTLSRFVSEMVEGFEKGAKEYGTEEKPEANLFLEMRAELRDVACYAFLQYQAIVKLEALHEKIKEEAQKEKELFE
jgi:hypothetical protein